MKLAPTLAIIALSTAGLARAEVQFDQLSACDDLSNAMNSLSAPARSCRQPRTSVESAMVARFRYSDQVKLCWLDSSPSEALSRFACLRTDTGDGARALNCITPADRMDISHYRDNYTSVYASRVAQYLKNANQCAIGNGNATKAVRTLLSPIIGIVARFDLGFVLPVGRGEIGDSVIVHGYGSVDPDVAGEGAEIEFVTMWRR